MKIPRGASTVQLVAKIHFAAAHSLQRDDVRRALGRSCVEGSL